MSDLSVFVYIRPEKRGIWKKFRFEKQSDGFYEAVYPVNDKGSIGVRINPETKQVEILAIYTECPKANAVVKTDVLPYDLNIKDETAFGTWLDDCIEDWWLCLSDNESDEVYDDCDDCDDCDD